MPEQDELDRLIDSALANYAEPRPGLERRMLAQISGKTVRPSWPGWVLAATTVMGVAVLLLLLYLVPWNVHPQPGHLAYTPPVQPVAPDVIAPAPDLDRENPLRPRNRNRDHIANLAPDHALSRPKLDIFPTLQPLNAAEQALSRFATEAPVAQRKALVEAQPSIDEHLNISAIRITPLQSPEEDQH